LYLSNFKVVRPHFETDQEVLFEWILKAHAAARQKIENWPEQELNRFKDELRANLLSISLGKERIARRGFQIPDCTHDNWDQMQIFNINAKPEGHHLDVRMAFFNESSFEMMQKMYENQKLPPHLVHVTCTGCISPGPARRLVSQKQQGTTTTVTNAHQMGCYGAIPAIRMAMGHYAIEKDITDIVHTELCTLHFNPTLHTKEQLMVQSLFADGFIKYSLGAETPNAFKVLSVVEHVINDTTTKMTWDCSYWGFQMSISKDIPALIRRHLKAFLTQLAKKAGRDEEELYKAHFSIHPGGPKIIDQIQEALGLSDEQVAHSRAVLLNYGNMSSATMPHVWERLLQDPKVNKEALVVSMAFGPGLSFAGALFERN